MNNPFTETRKNLSHCPNCNKPMNPLSIVEEERCGFLNLTLKSTVVQSCRNCGYKHEYVRD